MAVEVLCDNKDFRAASPGSGGSARICFTLNFYFYKNELLFFFPVSRGNDETLMQVFTFV